ncbi:hypothetical protein [Nitrosomonas sp. Is79A3]|uniref:hypothetical protein n=1 Tax=Nitrosomonas sp. (strain Is79A3) TaxID=261292 RepID=UPI0012EA0DE8
MRRREFCGTVDRGLIRHHQMKNADQRKWGRDQQQQECIGNESYQFRSPEIYEY